MKLNADTVIVGSGVAGLFSALNLPREQDIILITKSDLESSDSFLAQGGICVLRDESDYDSYFEDTMKAGHYENRKESVDIMIRNSRDVINDLVKYGVEFEKKDGEFAYTREGAHSRPRILFHEDVTGKEITSKLLAQVKKLENVKMYEYTEMTDVIIENDKCVGIKAKNEKKMEKYLNEKGLKWEKRDEILDVRVENTMDLFDLITPVKNQVESLEAMHGTMDDVFLNITGRKIRE